MASNEWSTRSSAPHTPAGSRLLERGADLHTVRQFLDHANISTGSRYLKPSKLALHTTIRRIEERRRQSGEAAKWEQELADLQKTCASCHKIATSW